MNKSAILFLYEGDTEKEFYDKIFKKFINSRKIRLDKTNLGGGFNLNNKVRKRLYWYLDTKKDVKNIYVFVAIDREGQRHIEPNFNSLLLMKDDRIKNSKHVKSKNTIIATQDLESWLFYDLTGIYKYLKVSESKSNLKKYQNPESENNVTLSRLFRINGRHYLKGKKSKGLIDFLDLDKIYNSCSDLREGIDKMQNIIVNQE